MPEATQPALTELTTESPAPQSLAVALLPQLQVLAGLTAAPLPGRAEAVPRPDAGPPIYRLHQSLLI
ncbi:MAG: hypothetical protein ABIL09_12855 [Gemmatimonadota bacterium]